MATSFLLFGREGNDVQKKILDEKKSWMMNAYPIGFWNYTNLGVADHMKHQQEADVQQWNDAGFTFAMSPVFAYADPAQVEHIKNMLDWAAARNMKLILCDVRGNGMVEANRIGDADPMFRSFLADFRNHPGLLGTFVADEPNRERSEPVFRVSRLQREIAPELLPFVNLYPWWGKESEDIVGAGEGGWEGYLDRAITAGNLKLLSFDHYAQLTNDDGIREHFANLRMIRNAAARHGIPFWVTLGCVGHWWFREPSCDDLRWQFNTALCAGASGIMWFYYYSRYPEENYRPAIVDVFWRPTERYNQLRYLHQVFHRRYGNLFNRLVSTKVMFYPKSLGGFSTFKPDHMIESVTIARSSSFFGQEKFKDFMPPSVMIGEFIGDDDLEYLMLVNASQVQDIQINVKLPQDVRGYAPNWFGGWDEKTNLFTERMAPGQELVLRLQR